MDIYKYMVINIVSGFWQTILSSVAQLNLLSALLLVWVFACQCECVSVHVVAYVCWVLF